MEMRKFNVDPINPEIVRIGNIMPDGSKIDAQQDGAKWHQDGSLYCQHHMMRIITLLHSKTLPESGGATEFLDLQTGWEYLKDNYKTLSKKMLKAEVCVEQESLNQVLSLYDDEKLLVDPIIHPMVEVNPFNNKETLFLGVAPHDNVHMKDPNLEFTPNDVVEHIKKALGSYTHIWEKGDLMIWDNMQVIHKAEG